MSVWRHNHWLLRHHYRFSLHTSRDCLRNSWLVVDSNSHDSVLWHLLLLKLSLLLLLLEHGLLLFDDLLLLPDQVILLLVLLMDLWLSSSSNHWIHLNVLWPTIVCLRFLSFYQSVFTVLFFLLVFASFFTAASVTEGTYRECSNQTEDDWYNNRNIDRISIIIFTGGSCIIPRIGC